MAAAVAALTIDQECELIDLGVEPWIFSRGVSRRAPGLVGSATISLEPGGTFFPDPLGDPAFLTPIRRQRADCCGADAPHYIWDGDILDIIAWHPDTPGSWAWRNGDSDALWLGLMPWPYSGVLPIHSSPLAWLRAGCRGICPLTEDCSLLLGMGAVIAESYAHREYLARKSGITHDDDRWWRERFGTLRIEYPRSSAVYR